MNSTAIRVTVGVGVGVGVGTDCSSGVLSLRHSPQRHWLSLSAVTADQLFFVHRSWLSIIWRVMSQWPIKAAASLPSNQLSLHRRPCSQLLMHAFWQSYQLYSALYRPTTYSDLVYANVMYNITPPNPNRSNTKPNPNYSPLTSSYFTWQLLHGCKCIAVYILYLFTSYIKLFN